MKHTITLLTALLLVPLAAMHAADSDPKTFTSNAVEKVDLFEAGKDGYRLYRIPGIVVTKKGTVLAYCEARKGVGDWGQIDVMMRRSTDGGKTWLPRQKIVHVEGDLPLNPLARRLDRPGDNTVNNPVAIVDHETGAVHFLYCLEYMRCFYMRSDDDGATWTEPVEITKTFEEFRSDYDWKILATGPSHAIQLTHGPKRGRLVVPAWLSLGTGRNAHRPSVVATIYSDDHGKTWQRGDIAVPNTPEFINPNETAIVQLADGSVMLNSRSDSKQHRRLVTVSPDGATNWSEPKFDQQLLEPICMAGIVRVREPGDDTPGMIAFSNPHNLSRRAGPVVAGKNRDRRNVSIKLSYDEGKTWAANRTLETGFSGYTDLAVLPDGTILCLYERGSTDGKNHYLTSLLTVARVTEDWVRDGDQADKAGNLPGIVMDGDEAEYEGNWAESSNLPALVGPTYHHDGNKGRGEKSTTFTATIPKAGDYEIRLLYTWSENRSSRTKVTVMGAGDERTFRVNQREPAMKDRVPNALGVFRFKAGAKARVTVSNEGADGYVIVDGLQILPAELAREERAGKRPSGYAAIEVLKRPTPAAAVNPPVVNAPRKPLKPDSPRAVAPADVDGKTYDLVIFGGTPGGIAMAVRAAREGLNVLLVNHTRHIGGFMTSGAGVWDTLYEGKRSPIYDEARQGIFDYYRETYGEHSAQYRRCLPGKRGHSNGLFEPAVAEHVLTRMVNAESRITVLCDYFIADAERDGALLETATFRHMQEKQSVTVSGKVFADCSYEGDLAAVAKAPYRVGRESREEFGEPHAGVTFMGRGSPQTDAERRQREAHKKLNLRIFRGWQTILPGSTGEGDSRVQAFNYRTVLTDDPANRLPVTKPEGYDRLFIAGLEKNNPHEIPNRKYFWNRPQVVGPHNDYVEGDWATRQRVMDEHWQATLGMLYFMQNDESVPAEARKRWKQLGLAADEFPDNGHRPYEFYVREARRIVGRYVFTQHDGSLPADLDRAPVHSDSVGITEWYFDSHACTKRRVRGSLDEGKHMLWESTFPGQVPYRALLPKGLDNLFVPVCLSSTHVAWGAIRLEPTWMNLAESAAYAAGIAVKTGVAPSDIDSDALLRRLAEARVMITFFNDIDLGGDDPRVPAAQYFGAKGFFSSYDARLDKPLTEGVQRVWKEGLSALRKGRLDAMALARKVRQAEAADSPNLKQTRGEAMLSMWREIGGGKSTRVEKTVASASGAGAASKPNVLFLCVDDINDWIGCLGGHPQTRTPAFDRLAARSQLFSRAYCAAPACNPSRVALLTGRRPSSTGMYYNAQKFRQRLPDAVTLPQHFSRHGYRVIGGGKIFHHANPDPQSWQWYLKHELDPIDRGQPQKELPDNYRWKPIKEGGDEAMGDFQVVRWAEGELAQTPEQPTFMAVGLYRPHMPWMVPKKYFDQFPLESIDLPEVPDDDLADVPAAGRWFATNRGFHEKIVRLDQWKPAVRGYLASIAYSDAMLGRVLDALEKGPWRDNTIVVLWGDHGMHLGEKEHWTKYGLWEKSTRTPLMIAAPGITKPGTRCETPVSLLDLYPTLLELCRLPQRGDLDGESLMPQLKNPKGERGAPAITTFGPNNHAVRLGSWRYIRYADGSEELYNLAEDPHEWRNLASAAEHAEQKRKLAAQLPPVNQPHERPGVWKLPERFTRLASPRMPAPRQATPVDRLAGVVIDNTAAKFMGDWVESGKQPAIIGPTYHHDGNKGRGEKSTTFTATIPKAGDYEIRLLFTWSENRSSRTKITVTGAGEEKTFRINQREPAMKDRVPNALGIFRFEAGAKARVTVSNEGADGYVIVDALQILPAELAREERAGKRPSGYAAIEMLKRPTPAAAVNPPVVNAPRKPLKPDAPRAVAPADVDGKTYDLVIFGGTPGGIAMAVRAAREGLSVLLVNRNRHLGGFMTSGARVWDTLYEGKRSPIYDEARQSIFDYYRETYGERSVQYRRCLPGKSGHTNGQFEPAVAEHILTRMVNAEPRITVLCDFFIADAQRDGAQLKTATFRHMREKQSVTVSGKIFADCSYEGDLAAVAKVPYRVGRESRKEFGEPHAGVVYMGRGSPQTDAERRQSEAHKKLNLRPFRGWQNVLPGSTGEGDSHVQAFNYRTILTDDPANRLPVARPDSYDRDFIAGLEIGDAFEIPNRKFGWNRPQVVGPHNDYVEGDWATRQRVMDEHWQATLGMLYFMQHDESVPPQLLAKWKNLGLAADEFPDNGHRPYEIYVREARRIVGRYVFTQHDGSLPADLDRAPVHPDSIGITEWYFDTHACTKRRVPGSLDEGKHMLHENTFPGQVPYRALLPKGLDNFLVPVCLSSTHVAWGTIRLEPTWMNLAESAAYAAGLALETGVSPSDIDSDALLRRLAEARVMITFFNDIDLGGDDPRIPATQYFGTKGFFSGYDAKLDKPLTEGVQRVWKEGLSALRTGRLDAMALARKVRQAEVTDSPNLKRTRGEAMLSMWREIGGGKSASVEKAAASASGAGAWARAKKRNAETQTKPRPNVLFIPVDDLNDWLGVLQGHPQAKTPNFDRLAQRGTLFTRAYCTAPACNPSRKSVLTGTRPSTSGLYYSNKRIRQQLPGVVTLPEHFKHNGYRVEGGGKIFHHGMNDRQSWHAYFNQPKDPEPRKKPHVGLGLHHYYRWQPLERFDDDDMADGKLVNWATEFLNRDHDKPFFLGVGFWRPHMPWHVPQKYFDLFPLEDLQLPTTKANDIDDLPGYGRWLASERTGFHAAAIKQKQWKPAVQAYLACIAFADAQLGRLLDALYASPHADNTIIVLWSDNGMHLGEKEHWTKWGLWEQATRVPLMVVAPGVTKPGARCETPVSLLDLYPTLSELCDLPAVDRLEGESLVPLLKDPRALRDTPAITTHGHMNHSVRTARWRYIRYRDGSEELYDHEHDPAEWRNVAGVDEHKDTIRALREFLPKVNVADPPYLDRKQYWPRDPSPADGFQTEPNEKTQPASASPGNAAESVNAESLDKLNVVFILIDDLGWTDVGCYGSEYYETPSVDRLAEQGMKFTDAYAACCVCSPTRASILTGKYPGRLHITHAIPIQGAERLKGPLPLIEAIYTKNLPLEEVTIAEALKEAGYVSASMGKWHVCWDKGFNPEDQGFDLNVGGNNMGNPGNYFYPYNGSWRMTKKHPLTRWKTLPDGKPREYLTDRLTDEATAFIEKNKERPFFLYLSHYAVHTPLQAKKEIVDKYKKKPKTNRHNNHTYAAMIESVDQSVGRVMKKLEELAIDDRTVVIFTSDNGGHGRITSHHPLRGNKGNFYEGGIRVPLIVKWPGVVKPGSECRVPVTSTDFYPTILAMAGLPPRPKQHMDGVNIVPLLNHDGGLKRSALYWHYPNYMGAGHPNGATPCSVIRQGDWKLIESLEDNNVELYNLEEDLSEKNDLASKMPEKAKELRQMLEQWRKDAAVQMPRPNPEYRSN